MVGDRRTIDREEVVRAAEGYLSAADELSARRILNAHQDFLWAVEREAVTASRSTRRTRQMRRRLALIRRAAEIGPTDAFFEAAERKDLPFPLTESKPDTPAREDVPADLVPLLLEAVAAGDPHAIASSQAALQKLIDAWEKVITDPLFDQASSYMRVNGRNHLLVARTYLFDLNPQIENLDRIIVLLRDSLSAAGGGDYATPGLLNNLGNIYERRYRLTGALDDLEEALRAHNRSVDEVPIGHDGMVAFLNSYANSLWSAYQRMGGPDLARRASIGYERALRWCAEEDSRRPGIESNLADVYADLRMRSIFALRPKDTDRYTRLALSHGKKAVELTRPNSPDYPRHLIYYARALDAAATILPDGKKRKQRSEALRYAGLAMEQSPPHSGEFPFVLAEYAALARKAGGVPPETIAGYYQEACRKGLEVSPSITIAAARAWARAAGDRSAWAEASEAWGYALQAMQLLFRAQTLRGHQETWLREFGAVPVEAALAAARANQSVEAVVALERGRTMILSESLSRELADLDRIEREGHAGEAVRFRRAAAGLGRLQAETADLTRGLVGPSGGTRSEDLRSQLQAARRDYDGAVAAIQGLPGHGDFLRPVSYGDIARASRAAPIVYLLAARDQGMAMRVTAEGEPEIQFLPGMGDTELGAQVSGFMRAYRGRGTDARAWRDQLDQTCQWLWAAVLGPCFESGLIADRAVLVPAGQLSLLPLHAAWRVDEAAIGGRRYALDEALLTYAPSAQAVAAAQRRVAGTPAHGVLAVADPSPVSAPGLPGAAVEADAATEFFAVWITLRGPDATRDAVIGALAGHQVHHFACHASADTGNPLESALLLAHDERLKLSDIMKLTLRQPRLSFLSACETAIIGERLPDEVIGLHTALMQVGVPGVVGSLWAVLDESTALLVARFYDLWRNRGLSPPEALREAQKWLRDATNAEIESLTGAGPDRQLGNAAYKLWGSARSHAHPLHWAAFAYSGV